jgi:hypothetical protein
MFDYDRSKEMSTILESNYRAITSDLGTIFRESISGADREIVFLERLLTRLKIYFNELNIPELRLSAESRSIHQKPLVTTDIGSCELGDLLVVIKYSPSFGIIEAKSIIYQIKLARHQNSRICHIDQRQLKLLCEWPLFTFGGVTYNLAPKTIEFGSFMLEPRNPFPDTPGFGRFSCYGKCPKAMMVKVQQSPYDSVNIDNLPYTRPDANNFFSHLAFEIGEHHSNQQVEDMVKALYRFIGLDPDPPDEFKEYYSHSDEDGFGALEIRIESKHPTKDIEAK